MSAPLAVAKAAKAAKGAKTGAAAAKSGAAAKVTTEAERHRAGVEQIKARRKPAPALPIPSAGPSAPAPAAVPSGPAAGARFDPPDAVSSGAGFVLGLAVWIVAVNYLRGGTPQVKQLIRAKFLNQT